MAAKRLIAISLILGALGMGLATRALAADKGEPNSEAYADPLAPFNEKMFWLNLRLDQYIVRPAAEGYAFVLPEGARHSVGNFFNNVNVIPRFANNLFQLKMADAGTEVARFGINTTLGLVGFFDVANDWFGLKEHDNDFGLTMGHYGVPMGPYLMLPFLGPSSVRDAVGRVADGSMNPMSYTLPVYITVSATAGEMAVSAVNYRSLNMQIFEDADRYSLDLYGAVQDAYFQRRKKQEGSPTF